MKQFDLKQSIIWPALRLNQTFQGLRMAEVFFWLTAVVCLIFFIPGLNILSTNQVLALIVIFLILALNLRIVHLFFIDYLRQPPLEINLAKALENDKVNLADFLTYESAVTIRQVLQKYRPDSEITTPQLAQLVGATRFSAGLISKILAHSKIQMVLEQAGLLINDFEEALANSGALLPKSALSRGYDKQEPNVNQLIKQAAQIAQGKTHQRIEITDLLAALGSLSSLFQEVLFKKDIDKDDFLNIVLWVETLLAEEEKREAFWHKENLGLGAGIGKSWTAGWTYYLNKYAFDVTAAIGEGKRVPHLISRRQEVELLQQALAGARQNNVLLVGEPGVGKKTLVYNLAQMVLLGESLPSLKYKRVLELDLDALLVGEGPQEIESRFSLILKDAATAGNVILFIDQIHRLVGTKKAPGRKDLSLLILPYLEGTELQLIGATDYQNYHQSIERKSDLRKVFEKIEVNPPSKEETILILEDLSPSFERRYSVKVTYQAIKSVANLAERFIQDVPFPEKAIDILEAGMVLAHKTGDQFLTTDHINKIISQRTELPIGEASLAEKEKLLKLEAIIHQRIINQEEAVREISQAMRRSRAGIAGYQRPMGTFLFLGPTGVGKTETAKALAEAYFGSEKRMIRLDMSEYQEVADLEKFLGSADGQIEGQLTSRVKEDPFTLVLLDELEKAHPKILNLFLQILDEGRLTDAQGQTVSFLSTIIIATSNAAAEFIREHVLSGKMPSGFREKLLEYLQRQGIFTPEFLNRFDALVVFRPLTKENLQAIARLMLDNLTKRVLAERDIEIIFTQDVIEKVARLGYDPQFGARPMRRLIQDRIETKVATRILSGQVSRGDKIYLSTADI